MELSLLSSRRPNQHLLFTCVQFRQGAILNDCNRMGVIMQVIFVKYYISNLTDEPEAMRFSAFRKRLSYNTRDVIKVNSVANSVNIWYCNIDGGAAK
jgi:hypothetical protein